MTTTQTQKGNGKSTGLQVFKTPDEQYFVSSSKGKICYMVSMDGDSYTCSCADFSKNIKKDDSFRCKHINAVIDSDGVYQSLDTIDRKHPKLNPEFIKELQGKDFVLYSGLLDLAHQKGLIKLDVEIVQHPSKDNDHEAICRAVAETKTGERFSDIGDASPRNTNKIIASHIMRMASTRAKARALRDLTNIGITCLEELGDLDEIVGSDQNKGKKGKNSSKSNQKGSASTQKTSASNQKSSGAKPNTQKTSASNQNSSNSKDNTDVTGTKEKNSSGPKMSEAQNRAVFNLAKRRGISEDELNKQVKDTYGVEVKDLLAQDASKFIRQLQSAA